MLTRTKIEDTLGKGFADSLDEYVLFASRELSFTRRQMIEDLGCANFLAARRLEKILKKLGITTVNRLFKTDPFSLLRAKGVGQSTIYVAMCILDTRKYDVGVWWQWYGEHEEGKFSAYKNRAARRANKRKQEVA